MANSIIALGVTADGTEVFLSVCGNCWQQITGLVLAEVFETAIRREVRQHGIAGLTGGNDGS